MKHILGLACAAFALGLLGSPLAAQGMAQATPQADQLPPPPPFPPMPSSKPSHRTVTLGGHHSSRSHVMKTTAHKRLPARHVATSKSRTSHKASKSAQAGHRHKAASRRTAHKEQPLHFSKKTIRQCHGMTYKQIMRHSSCRALIKQELAAPTHKARTGHKARSRHRSKQHSTRRRRR